MTLTPLAQRLSTVARSPGVEWNVLVENVPVWPIPPVVPDLGWHDGDDCYAPSKGLPELLDALVLQAKGRGVVVDARSVLVANGGFDAMALIARGARGRGARRAVCAGPALLSVAELFRRCGLEPVVADWARFAEGALPELGPGDLVYANTPHNPTGACLSAAALRHLLEYQQRAGFTVVFDLVYDSFYYGVARPVSPLAVVDDWHGVYAVNSFSKNYGAPGLRVGWLLGERDAVAELTSAFELERISASGAAQRRALALCRYGNAPLVEAVAQGRKLVLDWARDNGVNVAEGDGGTQLWLDPGVGDTDAFADRLMAEERVVVTTGANYYPRHPRHIRFPVGLPPAQLEAGMDAIVRTRGHLSGVVG